MVLTLLTWGTYHIYWHWKQWQQLKLHGDDVWPIPRAIFGGIAFFALSSRIRDQRLFHDLSAGLSPWLVGAIYLVFSSLWNLPGPISFGGILSLLPLALAQRYINQLHRHLGFGEPQNNLTLLGALFGLVLWGATVYDLMHPMVE